MKIVSTFHQPSSVLASVKCQLSSRDLEHLVVAKADRIDVYSLQGHGLQHQCCLEVWGSILTIESIPIPGSARSNLLLLLGHPDPELVFLKYTEDSSGNAQLTTKKQLSLYERTARRAEFFTDVLVHPSGKLAVVSCYTGKLRIITFKSGNHDQDFDVMLPEINLFGMAFLPLPEDEYALAILYLDNHARVQLIARDILLGDFELSSSPSTVLNPTHISPKILPLPTLFVPKLMTVPAGAQGTKDEDEEGFLGGVLVVGGKKIMLYELASGQSQAKQRSKRRRLESKKKSTDVAETEKARDKEMEREARMRKVQGSVDWPWSEVFAICAIDPVIPRYFIGDSFGRLAILSLENVKDQGLVLLPLGETSPPTTLTYLTAQILYLGSHLGDSQLLQISPTPTSSLTSHTLPIPSEIKTILAARLDPASAGKGKARAMASENEGSRVSKGTVVDSMGSFVNELENFKNIAPIVDAILVDTDGSGERQIVTCSGGGNKGAINVVRNGADFQELASIPGLTDVTNVWSVRNQFEDTFDSHILVSTLEASHLFQINDADGETTLTYVQAPGVSEKYGLITNLPTLAFGNIAHRVISASGTAKYLNSQLVVQVTRKGAYLLECDIVSGLYQQLGKWFDGSDVVAASVNASQVLLALRGGRLRALGITEDKTFKITMDKMASACVLPEISTVSCIPLDPTKPYSNNVTVSYWGTNVIEVFIVDKKGFESVSKSSPLPALARSAFLYSFGSDHSSKGGDFHPYLLAGLADGSVVYFPWKERQLNDSDKKIISLGHAPVSLSTCLVDGKRTVFAAGNRAMVLSWEKKRLRSSPIMLKEVVAVSPLNTTTYTASLILATYTGLFIGRVQDLDKMHIRSIPMGLDTPLRIAYQPSFKVFGVGVIHTEPSRIGDPQPVQSSFRLLDDNTFATLANFQCEPGEQICSITTYSPMMNGTPMSLFCVGTFMDTHDSEPTEGRLLVFSARSQVETSIVATRDVEGCVYSLTVVSEMVVAAVNSAVMLFRLKSSGDIPTPSFSLELLSEWNHNYIITTLASYSDYIVAGDQLQSVSMLKVVNGKLQNVARDYGPLWPICVEASDEENIIAANDTLNIFTFTLTLTLGQLLLECDGEYHLADLVTKFTRGSLTSSNLANNTMLEAKHLFFTSSGRIGVIIDVKDAQLSLHLTALQRNLTGTIPGGELHTRFREPKNLKGRRDANVGSRNFIDGDFLEQFLTYLGSPEKMEKIVAGRSDPERLAMSVEEIQKVLENLQSMH